MGTRKNTFTKRGRPPRRAAKITRCRWLLLIDDEPVRQAALAGYWAVEKKIARTRTQVEAFETLDVPAYQRWEARTFGTLLTELREIGSALEQKTRILDAIDNEVFWSGCSRLTAYKRVMHALHHPEPEWSEAQEGQDGADDPEDPGFSGDAPGGLFGKSNLPPGFDVDQFDKLPRRQREDFRDFYEAMADMFHQFTGQKGPDLEEVLREERERRRGGRRSFVEAPSIDHAARRETDRIKELYRRLVRQLHPDRRGDLPPRERELWHEVQEAYRERDRERLEAVAARMEVGLNGAAGGVPVSVLLRMTRDLQRALHGLRDQLFRARKHPAWNFKKKKRDLARLEASRRRELENLLCEGRVGLAQATAALENLAARAEQTRAGKKGGAKRRRAGGSLRVNFEGNGNLF
ncbi:MAG: J domain-containing protein [Verrucomicrobiota bacterium]|nr:J domain-containing protein [Verrucomicrobiota bacterium]